MKAFVITLKYWRYERIWSQMPIPEAEDGTGFRLNQRSRLASIRRSPRPIIRANKGAKGKREANII